MCKLLLLPALLMASLPETVAQKPIASAPPSRSTPAPGAPKPHARVAAVPAKPEETAIPELREAKPDPAIVGILKQISAERIKKNIEKLVSFGTRHTMSAADEAAVKQGKGIGAAREWIKSEFTRYSADCKGCLEVNEDRFTQPVSDRISQPTELVNVYAILRGSDPEAAKHIYLVTGHYDSRNSDGMDAAGLAPGANDDGSGTAVSLECARVLSKHHFPATLIFLTVSGEEQGLYGSGHFAKMAHDQGWQIEGVLNNDIVGGNRTPGDNLQDSSTVRVFSEGIPSNVDAKQAARLEGLGYASDSSSRQLARFVRQIARQYLPQSGKERFSAKPIFRQDRFLRGGDHISFNEAGYPAVRFTEFSEDFNHQHQNVRTENGIEYGDVPKFVDFEYVANVARVNAASLAALALAPAPPQNVRMLAGELTNTTTLAWQPASDGRASGYEVVWRPTSEPFWVWTEEAGDRTQVTLPRSKDNVIFAVRSTDRRGHKSLPVVPRPVRNLDEK